ncbi:MAG: DUF1732 domain-containing protein [Flavobacteriales bacterium TMED191]|nr:MAG: DUF1732 domain-containing protein [Flavobacteriales bacterium TMED191]
MFSMTGYTKKDFKIDNLKFSIIIKSLNSTKGLDISIKAPRYLFDLEPAIKKSIDKLLLRGKIDFRIIELTNDKKLTLDLKKLRRHIKMLKEVSPDSDSGQILNAAVSLPDIFSASSFKLTTDLKKKLLHYVDVSILDLVNYRKKEGLKLTREIKLYIKNIKNITKKLTLLEKKRIQHKKDKLLKKLKSIQGTVNYDTSRLEQEMIYYFEKYDITEEKVRLGSHCDFFFDTLKEKHSGRKLSFLAQEILREINTIGSKANNFDVQKYVVEMKEYIEKTKEQLQNIL